jgi:hypothetical protein
MADPTHPPPPFPWPPVSYVGDGAATRDVVAPATPAPTVIPEDPPELPADTVHNPDALRVFRGSIPPGYHLIGVFTSGREIEQLLLAPNAKRFARTLMVDGAILDHVSEGADGRWQYGDNRR